MSDGRELMRLERQAYERGLADGRRLGIEEMRAEIEEWLPAVAYMLGVCGDSYPERFREAAEALLNIKTALRAPGVAEKAFQGSMRLWGRGDVERSSQGPSGPRNEVE